MPVDSLPSVPWPIALGFGLFVLALVALLTMAIYRVRRDINVAATVGGGLLLYLCLIGGLAHTGFYADFHAFPPHFMLTVLFALVAGILVTNLPAVRDVLLRIPPAQVVGWQAFRIGAELGLLGMYHYGVVPRSMTFEGSNFDILTGITALPVAYLLSRGLLPRGVGIAWNLMGLALLANVVRIAILAAPGPFYAPGNDVPNLAVAVFPFLYLPYLLVPFALFGHILSLRQLWRRESSQAPLTVQHQTV